MIQRALGLGYLFIQDSLQDVTNAMKYTPGWVPQLNFYAILIGFIDNVRESGMGESSLVSK